MEQRYINKLQDIQGTFLHMEINPPNDWIYLNWIGFQNESRTKYGMLYYLNVMKQYQLKKILSDNRNQEGPYPKKIEEWISEIWLPKARGIGLKAGATIHSPELFTQISADKLIQKADGVVYKNFMDMDEAIDWLRNQ